MPIETKTFDVQAAIAGQKKLQQEKGYPDFAPSNGLCYRCKAQIYEEKQHDGYKTGVSVERASGELITGCPHCNYSYCE
jgi:hypothetical protein